MNRIILLAVAALGLSAAQANAQMMVYDSRPTGATTSSPLVNGGATAANQITFLVADDLNFAAGSAGGVVNRILFGVANTDPAASFSARPRIRFWLTDGAGGGPGTNITGFSFNPIVFQPNANAFFFFDPGPTFMIPASEQMWVGITFDNAGGATATFDQLNELGVPISNPVAIGSSQDRLWTSATAGSNLISNPAGAINNSPFTGSPLANQGYQFQIVPEPTSLTLAGVAVVGFGWRRWKKKKA